MVHLYNKTRGIRQYDPAEPEKLNNLKKIMLEENLRFFKNPKMNLGAARIMIESCPPGRFEKLEKDRTGTVWRSEAIFWQELRFGMRLRSKLVPEVIIELTE